MLRTFRHKQHGHVISHNCLQKLPASQQYHNWTETDETPTHYIHNDDEDNTSSLLGLSLGMMAAEAIFDDSSSNTYVDSSIDSSSSVDMGGGDFGGGGSSDSW